MILFPAYDPTLLQPKKNESFASYWTSLSPFAPVFGVQWRFAEALKPQTAKLEPKAPKTKKPTKAKAKSKAAEPVISATKAATLEKPKAKAAKPAVAATKAATIEKPKAKAPKPAAKPAAPKPSVAKTVAAPKVETPKAETPKVAATKVAEAKPVSKAPAKFTPVETQETPKTAPKPVEKPVQTAKAKAPTLPPVTFKSSKPTVEPKPAAAPKTAAKPEPAAAPVAKPVASKPDDLTKIKGIGEKLAQTLNGHGVTTFAQIANWSERDVDEFEAKYVKLPGRVTKDKWIAQAKALAGKIDA